MPRWPILLLICCLIPNWLGMLAASDRPNIVLCMGDDHGWDETGYNGHPHVKTPVLDEMAASGLRLDRFYSAHPSCSPTRGSIITGRHPVRYGTFAPNWSIRPQEISIARILAQAGYRCGHFGKWHLGPVKADSPTSPGAMGFHHWLSHDNFFEIDPTLSRDGGPPEKLAGESSQIIVDEAMQFMAEARRSDQPFFAVVWFGSPHEPYAGLPKDLALYDQLPASYGERMVTLTSIKTGRPTTRPFDQVLRERLAEITAMDRAIGSLTAFLDRQGLRNNTIVWYCSDNGVPSSGRLTDCPLRGEKGTMFEGGLRVPGIIQWPDRISSPRTSDVVGVTSDILPTLCEAAGLPLPETTLDGISLMPLIDGSMDRRQSPVCFWSFVPSAENDLQSQPWIDPKLQEGTTPLVKLMDDRYTRNFRNFHHRRVTPRDYGGARAIMDDRYKLVVDASGGKPAKELFDLRADPAEARNLSKELPEVAGRLEQQLRRWQDSVLQSLSGADYR